MEGCCRHPRCHRRCVGEVVKKFKLYENCCYDMVSVCCCCGHEYEFGRYRACPRCGEMNEPSFGIFGGFRGFGRF